MNKFYFLFLTIIISFQCFSQDSVRVAEHKRYFIYPKAYEKWKHSFNVGVSITRLPTEVVEEEINTSPVLSGEYRLGLPWDISLSAKISTNYISNLASLCFFRPILKNSFSLAVGGSAGIWYAKLDMQSIKLKSFGLIFSPYIVLGYDFKKFLVSISGEMNYGFMKTYSDSEKLATFNQARSLYGVKIAIEQPLWNNHSVVLGVKINYAVFYYQSWLSYSTIKDYLYYPEFSFSFII